MGHIWPGQAHSVPGEAMLLWLALHSGTGCCRGASPERTAQPSWQPPGSCLSRGATARPSPWTAWAISRSRRAFGISTAAFVWPAWVTSIAGHRLNHQANAVSSTRAGIQGMHGAFQRAAAEFWLSIATKFAKLCLVHAFARPMHACMHACRGPSFDRPHPGRPAGRHRPRLDSAR